MLINTPRGHTHGWQHTCRYHQNHPNQDFAGCTCTASLTYCTDAACEMSYRENPPVVCLDKKCPCWDETLRVYG